MGIVFLHTSNAVQEYVMDYTNCLSEASSDFGPSPNGNFDWRRMGKDQCELRFHIHKDMTGPVLQYYRLANYYQNQRLYVKSVEWDQLKGKALGRDKLTNCDPLVGPDDNNAIVYYPCGLIANSYFTDVFGELKRVSDGKSFAFPPKGIAWASDRKRYGPSTYAKAQVRAPPFWQTNRPDLVNPDGTYKGEALPNFQDDERFQVWMRVAGLPTFRKPYGKRDGTIPAGTYTILIDSNFEVKSYGASKAFVLSTTSWMGGRNPFLGYAYIITGSAFIGFALIFLVKHLVRPRPLGDLRYLSWRQNRP